MSKSHFKEPRSFFKPAFYLVFSLLILLIYICLMNVEQIQKSRVEIEEKVVQIAKLEAELEALRKECRYINVGSIVYRRKENDF